MKLYCTIKSIPELSGLSDSERLIAWHSCKRKTWRHWQAWLGTLIALCISVGIGFGGGLLLLHAPLPMPVTPIWKLLVFFLFGFSFGLIIIGLFAFFRQIIIGCHIRPYLRDYLETASAHTPHDEIA